MTDSEALRALIRSGLDAESEESSDTPAGVFGLGRWVERALLATILLVLVAPPVEIFPGINVRLLLGAVWLLTAVVWGAAVLLPDGSLGRVTRSLRGSQR